MSKTVKYSIIGVLVLITIVVVYFILKSGGVATTTPGSTGTDGTTASGWKIIPGFTQQLTDSICDSQPNNPYCKPA